MRQTILRSTGFSAVIAASLCWAGPVAAQDGPASVEEDQAGLGDIVVTARRQEETLQDAALAIDAISGEGLIEAGVVTAEDLGKVVPSIAIVNGGGQSTSIYLRGVGNVTNNSYYDAAISPSYDGVVLGRPSGAFASAFYDLARVEVLKGPQGILYGRNATGGAVNIIPQRPRLGSRGAGITTSFGNHDAVLVEGYLNLPMGDRAALRVSGTRQTRDGFNRDGSDDLDRSAARAQLLFEPSETLSIRLAGDYTHVGGIGGGGSYQGHYQGANFISSRLDRNEGMNTPAANAYRSSVLAAPGFGFLTPMNRQQSIDADYWGVHAEVNIETPIGDITFIPAYRETHSTSWFYGPAFNTALFDEDFKQVSAELRLAGTAGKFDYIVGGFFFDEDVAGNNQFNQEFVLPMQTFVGGTKSLAGFGQLTFNVSDSFRLIAGARYTNDKKFIDGEITNFITFCGATAPPPVTPPASFGVGCQLPGALPRYPNLTDPQATIDWLIAGGWIAPTSTLTQLPPFYRVISQRDRVVRGRILRSFVPLTDSGTFDKVTWKVSAEYDAAEDSLLYATVETGYRAGGFQLAEGLTSYKPETITAFTLGSKNRFFGNRLQLNLEAFYWKYKDQQITFFTISPNGVLVNANQNVGRSDIKGLEADAILKLGSNTRLNARMQYLDTVYKGLTLKTAAPRDNFNCNRQLLGDRLNNGAPIITFDCSGKPLQYSPKWTVGFGIEQVIPLGDALEFVASANTQWQDEQFGGFNYLPQQLIPAYWTSNANVTLRNPDADWSASLFVNNIENNRQISIPQASPIGFAVARYTAPRTWGLRLSADF